MFPLKVTSDRFHLYTPKKLNFNQISGVVSNGGYLYVVGGDDGSSNLASVECYDPKTNQWTLLSASMMTGRSYAGVTVIDKPVL